MYNIISSSSKGNAVLYHNSILVDCGVSFASLKPYLHDISIVILSHEHKDHINIATIKKLQFERPSIRIGCGEFMLRHLFGFKNIDIYEFGQTYDYGSFKISPVKLYHDCPNFGYRIFKGDYKIIHCTDTSTLDGIEAKGYNLFAIEHNYNEDTVFDQIKEIEDRGEFAYQKGAINTHLSEQQARDFIYKNKGENSEVVRLHESTNY